MQFLGDLDALDRLDELASQFVRVDNSFRAALVEAEVASAAHRFEDARAHLARAAQMGGPSEAIERQALAIDQACGTGLDAVSGGRLPDGATPVFYAAASGRLDVVKLLVARKARLTSTPGQTTILHQAAMSGDVPTIEYLLTKGLALNAKDMDGETPLQRAVGRGNTAAAELLKKKGAK